MLLGFSVIFLAVFGQGQENHRQLFLAYFTVAVKVTSTQDCLFKIQKILCIVVLRKTIYENLMNNLTVEKYPYQLRLFSSTRNLIASVEQVRVFTRLEVSVKNGPLPMRFPFCVNDPFKGPGLARGENQQHIAIATEHKWMRNPSGLL